MDRWSFFHLANMIAPDIIFQSDSNHTQAPIEIHLAINYTRYLGHEGNGACFLHLIPTLGVSNGSLCNFSKCCFLTLEKALVDQIKWLDRIERSQISEAFGRLAFMDVLASLMELFFHSHNARRTMGSATMTTSHNTQSIFRWFAIMKGKSSSSSYL